MEININRMSVPNMGMPGFTPAEGIHVGQSAKDNNLTVSKGGICATSPLGVEEAHADALDLGLDDILKGILAKGLNYAPPPMPSFE